MVNVYEIRPGSYATKAEVADAETEGGVTKEYVDAGLAEKQDVLTAGTNITIVENVISATGGGAEYTAGSGIAISGENVISNTAQPDVDKAYVDAQLALKANSASLATVATSGSYNDLSDKPSIPAAQVNADWNASSGVAEILNKPTIPSGDDLVPSTTGASTGDVLTVGSSGPEWATPSSPAPSNMVTTNTAQTVTGLKTLKPASGNPGVIIEHTDTTYPRCLVSEMDSSVAGYGTQLFTTFNVSGSDGTKLLVGKKTFNGKTGVFSDGSLYNTTNGADYIADALPTMGWVNKYVENKANMTKDTGAPTTATVGAEGDFYYDTTNDKLYQCTAVDSVTPAYTWTEVGGGSAPSNMVTTDTEQVITARKTFRTSNSNGIAINNTNNTSNSTILYGPLASDLGVAFWIGDAYTYPEYFNVGGMMAIPSGGVTTSGVMSDPLIRNGRNHVLLSNKFIPESIITGDGTTTAFTVTHDFGKKPGIVQVTDDVTGAVVKDADISIVKSTTNVVVTFNTAPADQATYTVAMLY